MTQDEAERAEAEAREPKFDETAANALRYFGLAADDEKAIGERLALMFVYVDDDSTYSWETRDALHTGLIQAFAEAVRRTERLKAEALVRAATDLADYAAKPTIRGEDFVSAYNATRAALAAYQEGRRMPDEFRLVHILGRAYGPDLVELAHFQSLIAAYLRLGVAFTVTVNEYGHAVVESRS